MSYAHEDDARARSIVLALRAANFSVTWDRDLEPGEDWRRRLLEAILGARLAVVVLWSHASVNSDFVVDEADRAAARKHLLLPTRIDDAALPLGFGRLQTLDLRGSNANELLVAKLEARRRGYDKPDPFPIFLVRRTLRAAVAVAVPERPERSDRPSLDLRQFDDVRSRGQHRQPCSLRPGQLLRPTHGRNRRNGRIGLSHTPNAEAFARYA